MNYLIYRNYVIKIFLMCTNCDKELRKNFNIILDSLVSVYLSPSWSLLESVYFTLLK